MTSNLIYNRKNPLSKLSAASKEYWKDDCRLEAERLARSLKAASPEWRAYSARLLADLMAAELSASQPTDQPHDDNPGNQRGLFSP